MFPHLTEASFFREASLEISLLLFFLFTIARLAFLAVSPCSTAQPFRYPAQVLLPVRLLASSRDALGLFAYFGLLQRHRLLHGDRDSLLAQRRADWSDFWPFDDRSDGRTRQ